MLAHTALCDSQVSSAAQQALYFRMRKKPSIATERLCNQLVHGMQHGDNDDKEVDRILVDTGVAPNLVAIGHRMSFAEAVNAGRTGALRRGELLCGEERRGTGRE